MNIQATQTRSQQRIGQLVNAGRPLTDEEGEELYRALHADYMHKWRAARIKAERNRCDIMASDPDQIRLNLLERLRGECAKPEMYPHG